MKLIKESVKVGIYESKTSHLAQQRNLFVFESSQNLTEQLTPLLQSMRPNILHRIYRDFRIKLGKIKRMILK